MSINIRPATKEDALFLGWVVVHAAQSHLEWGFFEAELYVLHLATIAPEARLCPPTPLSHLSSRTCGNPSSLA
jgi:hypothetical protein